MTRYRYWHRRILLGLLLLRGSSGLVAPAGSATEAQPETRSTERGAVIYQNLCAKCHGVHGEGVRGEYRRPLAGDLPLSELTKVIHKTMPDDGPEKCVDEDAAAVARYIYDAFYSPAAQARNRPARVELVRLTNRQYAHTVADLVKRFLGERRVTDKRGLHATYYNARSFKRDKQVIERVDARVDFNFGTSSPKPGAIQTNEFSIQWQGSVLAEETGDYEFILRTPNGVRVWVNDQEKPLIDAWVASGDVQQHRATVRLLGGRAYPLRLEFFKYKDKTGSIALCWKPPHGVEQVIPRRNLCPDTTTPTLVITTAFPPDDSSLGYERGVSVSAEWDAAATQAAIEVANYVVDHLDRLAGTRPEAPDRIERVRRFGRRFVETAFRRPLESAEQTVFVDAWFETAPSVEEAIKRVVLLALKSPRFLYLGLHNEQPDAFQVAERLAYGLWDSLPDETLWKAAQGGALATPDQVRQQARRMISDPRTRSKMLAFLHHWLQVDHVEDLSKDPERFPEFTPEIIADLRTSLNLFLEDVIWNGSSDYRELLLANHLWLNDRLARFYGLTNQLGEAFVRVELDPNQRCGVLTHPYLLAAFSYPRQTSPIHRGVFLTRNIVGRTLNPPPMAVAFQDEEFDPHLTMREKVAALTRPDACQTCHAVINPLGFSLEHYDAVGRYRTHEGDRPINAASDYPTITGESVHLTGPRDVARYAVNRPEAQKAFIEQLFHAVVKQPVRAYGPNVLNRLRDAFEASGFNVCALLIEIVTLSALHGVDTAPTTS